jgi:hypothetical protein
MTAHSDRTIRTLVVDDHQVVCQGLRGLLNSNPDRDAAAAAGDRRGQHQHRGGRWCAGQRKTQDRGGEQAGQPGRHDEQAPKYGQYHGWQQAVQQHEVAVAPAELVVGVRLVGLHPDGLDQATGRQVAGQHHRDHQAAPAGCCRHHKDRPGGERRGPAEPAGRAQHGQRVAPGDRQPARSRRPQPHPPHAQQRPRGLLAQQHHAAHVQQVGAGGKAAAQGGAAGQLLGGRPTGAAPGDGHRRSDCQGKQRGLRRPARHPPAGRGDDRPDRPAPRPRPQHLGRHCGQRSGQQQPNQGQAQHRPGTRW